MLGHVKIATYEPDNSLKKGYLSIFGEIVNEVKRNGWLTYQLFKRDFFAMYQQSFIGLVWIIILPLVNVATFLLLSRSGIFNLGDMPVPYPLYALLGMAFWQIFATGILSCGSSLTKAGEMILRINFSKKSLVMAEIGKPIISFVIQFVLVGILFVCYRVVPHHTIFLVPIVVLPVIVLTLGLGFMVALLNAIVRDTGNVLSLGMTLLMYLTPVLYARPQQMGLLGHITKYNPMYYFITAGRDLVLKGTLTEPKGFVISSLVSLVILLIALMMFHLTETRIAERI